jgi:hypothetical protein
VLVTQPVSRAAYDRIMAVVDGVDAAVIASERKWGVGRLRLLVDDAMRARWDTQWRLWSEAVVAHELADVEAHGAALRRALDVLDAAAASSGATPIDPEVWEIEMPDGRVVALCRANAEAHAVARQGRYVEIWTAAEIARVIDKFPEIATAKQVFLGATVERIKYTRPAPDWECGDLLPEVMSE